MITQLHLQNVGPVPDLNAEFGSHLNLVTGDNGLGKTFLLDACWCALTRTWSGDEPFLPRATRVYPLPGVVRPRRRKLPMSIDYSIKGKRNAVSRKVKFDYRKWDWIVSPGRPPMPGLVLYARIDGGFSVWDPARNYWRRDDDPERLPAFQFSKSEIWDGSENKAAGELLCNGLIRDLETWRLKKNAAWITMQKVLATLSPSQTEQLTLGDPVRISPKDARDIPTLSLPYGDVPVVHAASGMRRILALAYLLVWAWTEHQRVAEQTGEVPGNRMVVLIDEVEAHLHPKWQRVILPALFEVLQTLIGPELQSIQVIASTHAPLVLASVETDWDEDKDALFDFDLGSKGQVEFRRRVFAKRGSTEHWLTSESFDLRSAYSLDAERAIERAEALMRRYEFGSEAPEGEKRDVEWELRRVLGNDDEFWPRWTPWFEDAYQEAGQ